MVVLHVTYLIHSMIKYGVVGLIAVGYARKFAPNSISQFSKGELYYAKIQNYLL